MTTRQEIADALAQLAGDLGDADMPRADQELQDILLGIADAIVPFGAQRHSHLARSYHDRRFGTRYEHPVYLDAMRLVEKHDAEGDKEIAEGLEL